MVGNKVVTIVSQSGGNSAAYACDQSPSSPTLLVNLGTGVLQADSAPAVNGLVFFSIKTIEYPSLWQTDGTTAGTTALSINGSYGGGFSAVGSDSTHAYFAPFDQLGSITNVLELNAGGSNTISVNNTGGFGGIALYNGALIICGGNTLYQYTDATGAVPFATIDGPTLGSGAAMRAVIMGGILYFVAHDDLGNPGALWRTDGTSAGTYFISAPRRERRSCT